MIPPRIIFLQLTTILALSVSASLAPAATISWGSAQTISGNSDISTSGSLLNAILFGATDVTDTNGDVFHHVVTSTITIPPAGTPSLLASQTGASTDPVTVSIDHINYGNGAGPNSPGTPDANYNAILSYLGYDNGQGNSEASTVTLNGLTPTHTYQVEIWASQSAGATPGNSADISGGPGLLASTAPGKFAVGSFTADATSQTFTFSSSKNPVVNAVMLRATPEPGSLALVGVGIGALLTKRRAPKQTI